MLSSKTRTIILAGAAVAVLSIPTGASAAIRAPGTVVKSTPVQSTVATPLEVGSAGVPGYDNAKCEELLHAQQSAETYMKEAAKEGDKEGVHIFTNIALTAHELLEDNCLIVD